MDVQHLSGVQTAPNVEQLQDLADKLAVRASEERQREARDDQEYKRSHATADAGPVAQAAILKRERRAARNLRIDHNGRLT